MSDDKRFSKAVTSSLIEVRNAVGDGLFTAYKDEPGWAIARKISPSSQHRASLPNIHDTDRLLMPAFGTASIRDMFPDMLDIAQQLVLKWERRVNLITSKDSACLIVSTGLGPDTRLILETTLRG